MDCAGLDLGGTYVKSGLIDAGTGEVTQVHRAPTPYIRQGRIAAAVDVDELMRLVNAEVARLTAAGARALLVSNQMHGIALVSEDLELLTPAYTWQVDLADQMPGGSDALIEEIGARLGEATRRALGNELRAGLPIVTLASLVRRGDTPPDGAIALSVGDLVTTLLCKKVTRCHLSNAAASGLYDLSEGKWSTDGLAAIGTPELTLPEVVSRAEVVGTHSVDGHDVAIVSAIGDQQASLAGAGLATDELSVNIATGCQVSRRIPGPDTRAPQLRPYLQDDYLATVTHIPAGRALNAFARLLANRDADDDISADWARLEGLAAAGARGVRANVAVFPAARAYPGQLSGLTEDNMTPGAVFRAAMEDIADRITDAAEAIGARDLSRIAFSGGLAFRSDLMRRLITDRLGLPSRVVRKDADALAGLAVVAMTIEGHA